MKPNLLWKYPLTGLLPVVLGWLLFGVTLAVVAQDPPNFARVQALEKIVRPVAVADFDGGVLFAGKPYGTNAQYLGTNSIPPKIGFVDRITLAKLDRKGNALWIREARASGYYVIPHNAVRDIQNNVIWGGMIFTFGETNVPINLGGTNVLNVTSVANQSVTFVVKFDPDGNVLWAKDLGPDMQLDGYSAGSAIAAGPAGSFFLIGDHAGGAGSPYSPVLMKFDLNGNLVWSVDAAGSPLTVTAVKCDGEGNAFFGGMFGTNSFLEESNLVCAPLSNVNGGINDGLYQGFVAKVDASGNLVWVNGAGTNVQSRVLDICLDSMTNIIVTGWSVTTNLFGYPTGVPLNALGAENGFLFKCSTTGEPVWLRTIQRGSLAGLGPLGGSSSGRSVATDSQNAVYLGGQILGQAVSLDGIPLYVAGGDDAFIAKYSAEGAIQWALQAGNTNRERALHEATTALALCPDGVIAVGQFHATNAVFGALNIVAGSITTNMLGQPTTDICAFIALIPHPAPPLATELTPGGLKLSWPVFPPEFELETTTALGMPTLWSSNTAPVIVANGTNYVTLPADEPARYFRLRKPIP